MNTRSFFLAFSLLMLACNNSNTRTFIPPDDPNIAYTGRFDMSDKTKPVFMYSGCEISTQFTGTSVEMILKDESLKNMFTIVIDDSLYVLTANRADSTYMLAQHLENKKHMIRVIRRTEWHGGNSTFLGFRFDPGAKVFRPELSSRKMEFIGDSYTCGYGNEGTSPQEHFKFETENNYLSFGAITARALNAQYLAVCRSGIGIVQGYGGKRDFNMPAVYDEVVNNSRVTWDYSKYQPDVVVIDLITNDLSAPLDSTEFTGKYLEFLKRIRTNYPKADIVCLAGPSAPGKEWLRVKNYIHAIVSEIGKTDKNVTCFEFSPFELHGSDWHPNVQEHQKLADELIPYIKQLKNW